MIPAQPLSEPTLMLYTTASTKDTPISFVRQLLVSSVIKNAICKGFAGITETTIFEDAQARHLNQPDLYLITLDEA